MIANKEKSKEILSIILPTFNEYKNIPKLIDNLLKINLKYELELIFVDDNSSDGTGH